ncbi:MAG: T9SS C-terminal target domain-containing protein [Calditrichaeota bacterium]|nr:MAG: T9SS C-terminal target domain-containing protein [Calditrichota bacterium]
MNRNYFLVLILVVALPFAVLAQTPVDLAYGTLATGPNTIVFTNNANFTQLNVAAGTSSFAPAAELGAAGAIGYLTGTEWLIGMTSDAGTGKGDVFVFDAQTATVGPAMANFNDVRDLAVVDQGGRFDAIVPDRANDTVHLITDVLGTPVTSEITPSSIAGNVGIQGLVALSDSLYFIYDESPGGGFGSDELIVVEGNTTDAKTTRLSWNDIGSAGAGLGTDELSVDFHNGLAVRQPDPSTITLYLSNFGVFSDAQIIEVKWIDSGNGFDFNAPVSSVLFFENTLFNAILDNNPATLVPEGSANSRGVAILPGETSGDDQLVIWVDDSANDNTYILIYEISSATFSLFGGDALEMALETTGVTDRLPERYLLLQNYPNPFNPSTEIVYSLPRDTHVELKIVDALGRFVTRLAEGFQLTGEHSQTWNGTDQQGQNMPSGVYLCQLKTANQIQTHKLLLIR